jgi:ComF family protein
LHMGFLTIAELKRGIMHLFYPGLCEGCNRPLLDTEQVLCLSCAAEMPETGYHTITDNDTALRLAGRFPFVHATSYATFTEEGLLQHLLHGLKYKGKKEIGTYLGSRFAANLAATDWIKTIDAIIAVPLHPDKQAARGYNQSQLVAAAMGSKLGLPAPETVLQRVRQTESQTRKSRAERAANMEGAFEVADKQAITGKHILIVDDVLTTGATIEACALALLKVPGVRVSVATIGITM